MIPDWREHADRLARALEDEGVLHTPQWSRAFRGTPRHVFVPHYFQQSADTAWECVDSADERWLPAVYSNEPLTTALTATERGEVAISSSSKPGLMARMLEALAVRDDHRVLEVGTGTGYNAALLSARLGADRVFSVDIEPDLVELARGRLEATGFQPTLATADGAGGLIRHAPFDRIIATCSVPSIPWAWHEQLVEGGAVLVDLKPSFNAGNLVLLHRRGDRLEGRFLPRWAGFMSLRHESGVDDAPPPVRYDRADGHCGTTTLPSSPWDNLVVWFLAQLIDPGRVAVGHRLDPASSRPTHTTIVAGDGSWAEIALDSNEVMQGGPRRLWDAVEEADRVWRELEQPTWDNFGMTVTASDQVIWLDDPANRGWALPGVPTLG